MAKISVLGAGSWGTALSLLLFNNGHEVKLWSALEDEVEMLNKKRENMHPSFRECTSRIRSKLQEIWKNA